jgi:predicted Zn-dependent protease
MIGLQLPFQRRQESEADVAGLEIMARAGYDPRAGVYLWQNMKAMSGPSGVPEWLSTHPREDDRMEAMVPLLVPNLKLYNEAHAAGRIPNCSP